MSNTSDPDGYERAYMRANDALARQRIPMAWYALESMAEELAGPQPARERSRSSP